ncbi:Bug family tripartite tricarboxylate transporter substrate binding protein [Paracoccus sp. (in: a-proteobacteria)]|uniref:Bug family tripartite tricarboxylate transporter substrate binding protein n=1 Tax=Paracoccus sp. TaxID=267 RepID=UPI003A874761
MMKTRTILAGMTLFAMVGMAGAEITKPECVAPAQPGGGFDLTCRVAQIGLENELPATMKVTFMPGGIGAVAFNAFNTTRTDDANAIIAFSTGSLLNLVVGKFGNYTVDDVRWVGAAGTDYGAVIVRADSPFQTLEDLVKTLQEDPAGMVIGAGGTVGSQDWMKAALIAQAAGADPKKMRYVAFDGGGESMAGLLGGAIQVYTGDMAEMSAHLDGSVRILAAMSDERLPAPFADVPTAKEQGYDVVWPIMRGFYVGKNVSDEDYAKWSEIFASAHKDPAFQKVQAEKGLFPMELSGEAFDAEVHSRIERLRGLAVDAGLISQ